MNDTAEQTAQRIAARGREALVARLRLAFEEAAAAHADVLELEPEQLEEMVQRAVDRADGLQWRRALAAVATEELGIGLGEALSHPAVERAQELVGAPSYEESLAKLGPLPETDAEDEERELALAEEAVEAEEPADEPEAADEPEPADEPEAAGEPEPAESHEPPVALEAPKADADHRDEAPDEDEAPDQEEAPDEDEALYEDEEPDEDEEPEVPEQSPTAAANGAAPAPDEPEPLRLAAVHLGGIANLAPAESGIQLEFSEHGLDVIRGSNTILGRLGWEDIRSLEVPDPRGWRRRRREQPSHLVVRTDHGDASFEIPGLSSNALRDQLEPVRRYMPA